MGKLKLTNKIGVLGEDLACRYLENHGFSITDRNWRQNWGEIDIVAKKNRILHFFEVKSVSCENLENVSRETEFRPEENVHETKLKKLSRTVQSYLESKKYEGEWEFAVLAVYVDQENKKVKIELISEILS